ncbi:TAP domain-containing protein [Striga asiatica]|uniref:TAP domain-containing protein n=1 Tax=Striga asiatica TaxID=4170 RepID=A0A5A7PQX9_STRAF|nr:TAP domain-containing protein [Striga asiatica]
MSACNMFPTYWNLHMRFKHKLSGRLLIRRLRSPLRLLGLERLQLGVIIVTHTQESQSVPKQIQRRHRILNHRPREGNQQPILDDAGHVHGQRRRLPHKEEHGEVERERAQGIGSENQEIESET